MKNKIIKQNIIFNELPKEWQNYFVEWFAKDHFDLMKNEPEYKCKSWKDEKKYTRNWFKTEYSDNSNDTYTFTKYLDEYGKTQYEITPYYYG